VACAGARPLAITNCLNFGNPLKPEIFHQLSEAVRGIGEACRTFGTPVTGGNVSLYNENPDGAIWPTPVIGMIGRVSAPAKPLKAGFARPGLDIIHVGPPADHLGGSEYLHWKTGKAHGPCPSCNLSRERALIDFLVEACEAGLLASAHDCGVGGLAVTLTECVLNGADEIGADISIQPAQDDTRSLLIVLFAETSGRVIASVRSGHSDHVMKLADKYQLPVAWIGQTTLAKNHDPQLIFRHGHSEMCFDVSELRSYYESTKSIFS